MIGMLFQGLLQSKGRLVMAGIIVVALAMAVWGFYAWAKGDGREECLTAQLKATGEAIAMALEAERAKQKEVNRGYQKRAEEVAAVNARLAADVERLRQRPTRADLAEAARAECQGATGAELSAEDAEFLAGESARADRLRAALRECYAYADTVTRSDE